MKWL